MSREKDSMQDISEISIAKSGSCPPKEKIPEKRSASGCAPKVHNLHQ